MQIKQSNILVLMLALLMAALGLFAYGPGGDDDTHISYAAAYNLAQEGAILNHSGDAVEQGSSLLHILSLAASFKLINSIVASVSITDIGPLFSLLMGIVCLPLLMLLNKDLTGANRLVSLSLTVLSVSFSYWAMGGLESTLTALCMLYLVLSVVTALNKSVSSVSNKAHLVLAMLGVILVRPEGYFVIIAFLLALQVLLQLQSRLETRSSNEITASPLFCLKLGVVATIFFVLLCLWRYYNFDHIFPQCVFSNVKLNYLDG